MSNWSELYEELVHIISEKLEGDCFDIIHARSVCTSWRSKFPYPAKLSGEAHTLPSFWREDAECTLEKLPLMLFRVHTLPIAAVAPCEFFIGRVAQDKSEEDVEAVIDQYPIQSSVKLEVAESERTSINKLDCQVLSLGDHYTLTFARWYFGGYYKGVAVLPMNKEKGEKGFVVLVNCVHGLQVLTSAENKWKPVENAPRLHCINVVAFKGKFYASFRDGRMVVVDPFSLVATALAPTSGTTIHLVPSDDMLYLVESLYAPFRVSKLDEETGQWVEVHDLGDLVLIIHKDLGNMSCSVKEFPRGCGMSGNSILFANEDNVITRYYQYGAWARYSRYFPSGWRPLRENRVTILPSYKVLALRVVS